MRGTLSQKGLEQTTQITNMASPPMYCYQLKSCHDLPLHLQVNFFAFWIYVLLGEKGFCTFKICVHFMVQLCLYDQPILLFPKQIFPFESSVNPIVSLLLQTTTFWSPKAFHFINLCHQSRHPLSQNPAVLNLPPSQTETCFPRMPG